MPESEAVARLGQHASGARLVDRRDQVCHAAAEHDGQIGDREVRAEQSRRPQYSRTDPATNPSRSAIAPVPYSCTAVQTAAQGGVHDLLLVLIAALVVLAGLGSPDRPET